MIIFFTTTGKVTYAVQSSSQLSKNDITKLEWLFSARYITDNQLHTDYIGPRKEMVTPWSTNAVEITQNMGVPGITRIEEFHFADNKTEYDRMLQHFYGELNQEIFRINRAAEATKEIEDIGAYNVSQGLALNDDEVTYLELVGKEIGRNLTDSEVFGFSQVNSEHCRHKIFNGRFIIDGETMPESLFELIKKTSAQNPNRIVSAYKDNVAFVKGPEVEQFSPGRQDIPDTFKTNPFESTLSLKAETHNFPTTVEPFNGAATGSGGEIRDRMAGGKGSVPLAGTAVYMTSYPRLAESHLWEKKTEARKWLYQSPVDILIKASNGASDFGNKFGQPLICGSILTFEFINDLVSFGYDKVIMLAGGIGFGKLKDTQKDIPAKGDKVIVMGGDNYRIGMGGSAVSSVATGEYGDAIELNAIQRSNPEMQKRVFNAIRSLTEMAVNPVISIHDHGAGGHLNCLTELLESTGGVIDISKLPLGDPTLSDKEIIGNESQERMGLLIKEKDLATFSKIAEREKAPYYIVGEATGDYIFKFINGRNGSNPIDLKVNHFFGSSPKTILEDKDAQIEYDKLFYDIQAVETYLQDVLRLESVACKDWLTNKVDRCVTGKVSQQQTIGPVQLPLSDVSVMALDYRGEKGVATSIGHAPVSGLIDPAAGSVLSAAEALTNLVWAPIEGGLKGVSLSANWMWPAKNPGENARLYKAVKALSDFVCDLGINIPTGKDSLSMSQKYPDGKKVLSPGTVIISTIGEVIDIKKVITPLLQKVESEIIYIDFSGVEFKLGGSSFMQCLGQLGGETPTVNSAEYFARCFDAIQELMSEDLILAGHDISSGGIITCLLEMCFTRNDIGIKANFEFEGLDAIQILFSENPGVLIQVENAKKAEKKLKKAGVKSLKVGEIIFESHLQLKVNEFDYKLDVRKLRNAWFETSHLFDLHQTRKEFALRRLANYGQQELSYILPSDWQGTYESLDIKPFRKERTGIKAAIIREKGVNGDREMAWALHMAGFDVLDVHMTDLMEGRENLEDISFLVFVGGFSNSDVLGSAKGWAGSFMFNANAKQALDNFYERVDTLSLGVCNGCQLMMELRLLYPEMNPHPVMKHNAGGKFECHFLSIDVPENNSIMFKSLGGTRLGIWMAHGEGRFELPGKEEDYNIAARYTFGEFPGNPNGSDFAVAALSSKDGRHLAIMPHLERSLFPWNWAYYHESRKTDQVSPWLEAFINARNWVKSKVSI